MEKKEKRKVVSWKNMPTRLPFYPTVLSWLVLDKIQPVGWVWGVVGTLLFLWWVLALIMLSSQEQVELL